MFIQFWDQTQGFTHAKLSYIPHPRVCMHMGVHIGVHAHTCEQVSKESERILNHLELEL